MVKFKPNAAAPSEADNTQYNVFVDDEFIGYIAKDWMGYWWYYEDGTKALSFGGHYLRSPLFEKITTSFA